MLRVARTSHELQTALARVQLLVLDVDGTLTDGRIVYFDLPSLPGTSQPQVGELLAFDVRDGLGLQAVKRSGVRVVLITGRGSAALERRAHELDVRVLSKISDKQATLQALQAEYGLTSAETAAMGDDLPDLGLAAASALFFAPATAVEPVLQRADYVTTHAAGRGAVREVCELLAAARGVPAR